ncbi:hypothetical protein N8I84_41715 (plasmid) [Streptomyces cynarae]|uniref:Lipoprotein n=1 Tax=Streptomyces cynarae TaxID=2981134 RepID=A0ABY6EGN8_9ACTN|nr:hypothetical protein [Streptomyces cynarae]UXY24956.1 hypothetical protein N8I84_41715 [Streptomyces cynarae]
MSEMRRVGAAVVGLAAVLLVGGCGGGSETQDATASASPSDEVTYAVVPTDSATADESTDVEYAPGPEGEIDRKADEEGWTYDSLYSSASEYVQDICDSLPVSAKDGASRPQWLAESGNMDGDGVKILEFGVPKLCPKWTSTVRQAASGHYERWLSGGEYEVTTNPKPYDPSSDSDVQEIAPGTYRAIGHFSECYWERTSRSGDIIENKFVTQATTLTVTLRAGELFKNECGTFKPVG